MTLSKSLESELTKILETHRAATPHPVTTKIWVEEIQSLIQSELLKQREDIRSKLPEKRKHHDLDAQPWSNERFVYGFNLAIDQITKILEGQGD